MPEFDERVAITDAVTRYFHGIDARDWETVHTSFTDQVERLIETKHVEQVNERVAARPGITTGEGQFNSTTVQIGSKAIGRVSICGSVDTSYQQPLCDQLIADGRNGKHRIIPKSNYTVASIGSQEDIDTAVFQLWVSYLYTIAHIQRRRAANEKLASIDVTRELASTTMSEDVRSIFEEHFEWLAADDNPSVNQKLYTGVVS